MHTIADVEKNTTSSGGDPTGVTGPPGTGGYLGVVLRFGVGLLAGFAVAGLGNLLVAFPLTARLEPWVVLHLTTGVLLGPAGPVVIDLPQAVDASSNNNAFRMLERDVNNMRFTFSQAAPELLETEYAHEMWTLYEAGELHPDSVLTGRHAFDQGVADVEAVMDEIEQARLDAETRELRQQEAIA